MIHQLLTLIRPLFSIDVESTGLDTRNARIVELGFERWEAVRTHTRVAVADQSGSSDPARSHGDSRHHRREDPRMSDLWRRT